MFRKKFNARFVAFCKGLSIIELIVVIAIMAVLAAVLTPTLLQYVESSRAQKDASATSEMTHAVNIGMAHDEIYEELMKYSEFDNVSCYIDVPEEEDYLDYVIGDISSQYSFNDLARTKNRVPFYAAGNMFGVTITFEPIADETDSTYILKDGIINKFISSDHKRLSDLPNLCGKLYEIIGQELEQCSRTYQNSEYTIFVNVGVESNNVNIYGQYSGTNLQDEDAEYVYTTTTDRTTSDDGGGSNNGDITIIGQDECDHVAKIANVVAATCKSNGYTGDTVCELCGILLNQGQTIPNSDHIAKIIASVNPTCDKAGNTEGKACDVCGYVIIEAVTIPALGHSYNGVSWAWNTNESAKAIFVCAVCNRTETIDAEITKNVINGTCESAGEVEYTATVTFSGQTYTDKKRETVDAVGHISVNGGTKDVHKKCSVCGITLISSHTYSYSIITSATCTSSGTGKYSCACGYSYTTSIGVSGHSYSSSITKSPTCLVDGIRTYSCRNCSSSYTELIPSPGHTIVNGGTANAHTKCGVCGATVSPSHTYSSSVTTKATCTNTGVRTYTCSCGYSYTENIAKKDHVEVYAGKKNVHTKCSECGITISSSHSYSKEVTTKATCTSEGVRTYSCVCGHSYTEAIAMKDHKETYGGTASVHTKCSSCGKTLSSTHSYTSSVTKSATCTSTGTRKYSCDCGYSYTETIAKKDHVAGAAADCGTPQTCVNCSYVFHEALGHRWITQDGKTVCNRCGIGYSED